MKDKGPGLHSLTGLINKPQGQVLLFCLARGKGADALYKKAKGRI